MDEPTGEQQYTKAVQICTINHGSAVVAPLCPSALRRKSRINSIWRATYNGGKSITQRKWCATTPALQMYLAEASSQQPASNGEGHVHAPLQSNAGQKRQFVNAYLPLVAESSDEAMDVPRPNVKQRGRIAIIKHTSQDNDKPSHSRCLFTTYRTSGEKPMCSISRYVAPAPEVCGCQQCQRGGGRARDAENEAGKPASLGR